MKGIDVSEFQSALDLSKTSGYGFVIIRAGYGNVISQKDKAFEYHVQNAIKAGMKIGAYWFSYALNEEDARKEADVCAAVLEKYKSRISLPVFFDYEYDSESYSKRHGVTPTKDLITRLTLAFIGRIEAHGYKGGYYTNLDYLSRLYDYDRMKSKTLWLAQYEGTAKYPYYIRQTSAAGKINGVTVDLDEMDAVEKAPETYEKVNVTYHDVIPAIAKQYGTTEDALMKLNRVKGSDVITSVKIPLKSLDDIAKEVIAGKWGFWPFRSSNLKKAGYDPEAVQDRINELKAEGYF